VVRVRDREEVRDGERVRLRARKKEGVRDGERISIRVKVLGR
jgi:hypothetical protein